MTKKEFIREIANKCKNNEMALFLGAGMSSEAGLPSWKKLFEPLARELGIDINTTEYQLYDIAQFYANEKGLSQLHKKVSSEINRIDKTSETLDELANMQCNSLFCTYLFIFSHSNCIFCSFLIYCYHSIFQNRL